MQTILLEETNAVDEVLAHSDAVLFHVCNDGGVMGSGIALEIKHRIPTAFENYVHAYELNKDNQLGTCTFSNELNVCNLVAQRGYGNGIRHIHYGELVNSISEALKVLDAHKERKTAIIPFKMGAFRAGGDWETVLEITQSMLSKHFETLIICRMDKG